MINNNEIQKNLEAGTQVALNLLEVNAKNFSTLANLQINLLDNYFKNSVNNVESFKKVKDQKSLQDYLLSLKEQTEKEANKVVENYVAFTKDYAQDVVEVLNAKAVKTQ